MSNASSPPCRPAGPDPTRFRAHRRVAERYGTAGDVHRPVADRLRELDVGVVLDVGCGDGALRAALGDHPCIGVDLVRELLTDGSRPVVEADATALPVATASLGAVAALWMLYELDDPTAALAEAHRVLRPGGTFVTCTTARNDSPELIAHLPPQPTSTFDAEEAALRVGSVFADAEVEHWDGPYVHLPTRPDVVAYLTARGIGDDVAAEIAAVVDVPLDVTKRGVLVWARRR